MAPCTSAQHYTEGHQATDGLMASRGLSVVTQSVATTLEKSHFPKMFMFHFMPSDFCLQHLYKME